MDEQVNIRKLWSDLCSENKASNFEELRPAYRAKIALKNVIPSRQALLDCLSDSNPCIREKAVIELDKQWHDELVDTYIELLNDTNPKVTSIARRRLKQLPSNILLRIKHEKPALLTDIFQIWDWNHVDLCRTEKLQPNFLLSLDKSSKIDYWNKSLSCPICDKHGQELNWVYVYSSQYAWQNGIGRAGWLSICDDCQLQIEFFMTMYN